MEKPPRQTESVFTPKGFEIKAQGRERSERTLGIATQLLLHPESVQHGPRFIVRPFQGRNIAMMATTQGALAALATLGYVV